MLHLEEVNKFDAYEYIEWRHLTGTRRKTIGVFGKNTSLKNKKHKRKKKIFDKRV